MALTDEELGRYGNLTSRVKDIQNRLYETAGAHRLAAELWNRVQFWVGLPATLVAAIAGVSIIGNEEFVAGVLALLAAGLSAVVTFSRPIDRFRGHDGANRAYLSLADQVNNFFLRAPQPTSVSEIESLWAGFEDFQKKEAELNSHSPYLPMWYYRLLQKKDKKEAKKARTTG